MIPKIGISGLLIRNNKFLLIKRQKEPYKDKWSLPGGSLEFGERVENGIIREVWEETGFRGKILSKYFVTNQLIDKNYHWIILSAALEIVGPEQLSQKIESQWMDLKKFQSINQQNCVINLKMKIAQILRSADIDLNTK